MKHLAQITQEFIRFARRWEEMPHDLQVGYLSRHPLSRRKVTAQPPAKSPTSGLKIYDPGRSQSHGTLETLRAAIGAERGTIPAKRDYITKREGPNNKFHYFVIMKDDDDNFVAANAYGRIGYPNTTKVCILARSPSYAQAEAAYEEKKDRKMSKRGYKPTPL